MVSEGENTPSSVAGKSWCSSKTSEPWGSPEGRGQGILWLVGHESKELGENTALVSSCLLLLPLLSLWL